MLVRRWLHRSATLVLHDQCALFLPCDALPVLSDGADASLAAIGGRHVVTPARHGGVRGHASASAPEPAVQQPEQNEAEAALRGILARSQPSEDVRNMSKSNSSAVLRFGDLPATTQLIESFQGAAPPKQPVYDLSAWLSATYPQYDTRPRSPFYDWVSWVKEKLPAEQAAAFLALDQQWQNPRMREAILKKAQWELTQLWDWQHRREALGLPATPTPEETAQALVEVAGRRTGRVWAARLQVQDRMVHAENRRLKAQEQDGWQQQVTLAQAAIHEAHAMDAYLRSHFPTPTANETAALQAMKQALDDITALHEMLQTLAHKLQQTAKVDAAATTDGAAAAAAPASGGQAAATAQLDKLHSQLEQVTERIHQIHQGMQKLLRLRTCVTLDALRQDPSALAKQADAGKGSQRAFASAGALQQLNTAGDAGDRQQAAVASSSSSSSSSSSQRGSGLLAAMKAADQQAKQGFTTEQKQLLESLGLSKAQWAALKELRRSVKVDGAAPTEQLLGDMREQLNRLATSFKSRIKAPSRDRFHDKATALLEEEFLARKDRGGKTKTSVPNASLYPNNPSGAHSAAAKGMAGEGEAAEAGGEVASVVDRGTLAAMVRSASGQGAGVTWTQLPALARQAEVLVSQGVGTRLKTRETPRDEDLLQVDTPAVFSSDPHYREPYVLDVRLRPPTPTLDWMTDYLQVKYQDVLARQDAVARVEAAVRAAAGEDGESASAGTPRAASLSPQEVSELNRQATELFESGDVAGYTALLSRLVRDQLLSQSQLVEMVAAAQQRADELQGSKRMQSVEGTGADPVADSDRAALAALLSNPSPASAAPTAPTPKVQLAAAQTEWARARQSGFANPSSPWTLTLANASARALIAPASSAPQQAAPGTQTAAEPLKQQLTSGEFVSWERAEQLWAEYLEAAGAAAQGGGSVPGLAEVVEADMQLRVARTLAVAGDDASKQALRDAQAKADEVNRRLDAVHEQFLSRAGSGLVPGATFPGMPKAEGVTGLRHVQSFNAGLQDMTKNPAKLIGSFMGAPTVPQALRVHSDHTSKTHLGQGFSWKSDVPAWDQIWSLFRSLYSHFLTSPGTPSGTGSATGQPALTPTQAAGSVTPATQAAQPSAEGGVLIESLQVSAPAAPAPSEAQQRAQQQQVKAMQDKWNAYCQAKDARAAALCLAPSPQQSSVASLEPQLAPPYPGARPILRFTQCFVLSPASSLSSTQGLADRVAVQAGTHPWTAEETGYRPPSVLLPDHPAAKRVLLRVQVRDLAQEVGLTEEALQHLLRVAGPSRYESESGDLVLLGTQYSTREENRKWCLEALHLLLKEAHDYQTQGATSGNSSAFILERPGVVSMLHGSL